MPDQENQQAPDLSTEIGGALSSVWARYVGARPSSSEVNLDDGVVRWILPGGTGAFEKGMAAGDSEREPGDPVRTVASYERDTSAVVAKATHRRVRARMSKHDKKTGIATETFVLEATTKKY